MTDKYPTLHEIGLGPALEALERLALKGREKYPKDDWLERGSEEHLEHAYDHADAAISGATYDVETGERDALHAALRCLMAVGCIEAGEE